MGTAGPFQKKELNRHSCECKEGGPQGQKVVPPKKIPSQGGEEKSSPKRKGINQKKKDLRKKNWRGDLRRHGGRSLLLSVGGGAGVSLSQSGGGGIGGGGEIFFFGEGSFLVSRAREKIGV